MSVHIPIDLQRRIRDRFANGCAYCRTAERLTAAVFEFEHIVPLSRGGATSFQNLCLACPMCNRYKSDSSSGTDPVTGATVPLFHPQRDNWTDHFVWSADATEILGLTPIGRATVASLRMNRAATIRVRRMWVTMGEHPPSLD